MTPTHKVLLLNGGLLLGVAALLFQGYLPALDEINTYNQEMKAYQRQWDQLKAKAPKESSPQRHGKQQIVALPEADLDHLSQELEALARKHQVKLIDIEPNPEAKQTLSTWKVQMMPYVMGIATESPVRLAGFLAALEQEFPELAVERITYQKEVATVETQLLTSSQSVRLFAP